MEYSPPPVDPRKLTVRERLAQDSLQVFRVLDAHWLPVTDVLDELLQSPNWGKFNGGQGLTSHTLVRYLKDMGVEPEKAWWKDGKKRSGYRRDDLITCWNSWFAND
jgi:hypothetical protein